LDVDSDDGSWKLLRVFSNTVRVKIVRLLLQSEMASLSDIAEFLKTNQLQMSLPGLFKHMQILEKTGIVRQMSGGIVLDKPDARKTIYLLEGKERVERILQQLETSVANLLIAGEMFRKVSRLAPRVLEVGPKFRREEGRLFESLLVQCESTNVYELLTEDEKMKVRFWRKMMTL
jgi:DNA-binding transcriptional ArsR family regulator